MGSDFLLSNEGWSIAGNKAAVSSATFEAYSRGPLLNHYILGGDDKVNVRAAGGEDQSLWYFVAPAKFLGNVGIAYGGSIQFTLSAFSGDFSKRNSREVRMPVMHPVGAVRIVLPLATFLCGSRAELRGAAGVRRVSGARDEGHNVGVFGGRYGGLSHGRLLRTAAESDRASEGGPRLGEGLPEQSAAVGARLPVRHHPGALPPQPCEHPGGLDRLVRDRRSRRRSRT